MADNEFGYTAWGMDWVRLAEPLRQTRPDPLLPRARSIARNNGVQATVDGGVVRSIIHRGGQASLTHLEVAPLTRAAITAIAAIAPDPSALTDDMHRAIAGAGIPLAPVLAGTDCSCTARSARCVHVLAVYYEMARKVDEDPRLALEIQGYFATGPQDSDIQAPPARWTPISALDPTRFFTTAQT
ncbi:SWIM zinc finger-containing protein [Nocardia pneumoniae]|uniref:SWIM zinc finger-containing protein n=1 Tax=Nocardia pneumoniae TaxID=228601 RepID=UPI00030BDE60|nr:SWIM zinc finger-containing protein [Nocardia pneumoniae]